MTRLPRSVTRLVIPVAALGLAVGTAVPATAGAGHASKHGVRYDTSVVPSKESLRGLDGVTRRTAWAAGDGGGIYRTVDGGRHWKNVAPATPSGATPLMFRDVEASSRRTAVVLAIGEGDASRILRTKDGGKHWRTTFVNHDAKAFYDCMDFFPGDRRGLAMSDPVDGKFRILSTRDGGRSWKVLPSAGMPAAQEGEFAFAASGTCLETAGRHDVYLGSGGGPSRVFHSRDGGRHWKVTDSTIPGSAAGGVFSLAFRDRRHGVAVGGDFENEPNGFDASARTRTGRTWHNAGDLHGYRSGVDWRGRSHHRLVAVGPNGIDVTRSAGRHWRSLSTTGYHSVSCVSARTCWTSGSEGRLARITFRR